MALPVAESAPPEQEQQGYERISTSTHIDEAGDESNGAAQGLAQITLNGMQFTIYGNMQGFEHLQQQSSLNVPENLEEELADEQSRNEAEAAARQALEADAARRQAPLSSQQSNRELEIQAAFCVLEQEQQGYERISTSTHIDEAGDESNGAAQGLAQITLGGMQFTIYGNMQGFEHLQQQQQQSSLNVPENLEEELADEQSRNEAEAAARQALEADAARRQAPLSSQQREAVMEAMRNVNLSGYRPAWADRVSEEQLLDTLRNTTRSSVTSSSK